MQFIFSDGGDRFQILIITAPGGTIDLRVAHDFTHKDKIVGGDFPSRDTFAAVQTNVRLPAGVAPEFYFVEQMIIGNLPGFGEHRFEYFRILPIPLR